MTPKNAEQIHLCYPLNIVKWMTNCPLSLLVFSRERDWKLKKRGVIVLQNDLFSFSLASQIFFDCTLLMIMIVVWKHYWISILTFVFRISSFANNSRKNIEKKDALSKFYFFSTSWKHFIFFASISWSDYLDFINFT